MLNFKTINLLLPTFIFSFAWTSLALNEDASDTSEGSGSASSEEDPLEEWSKRLDLNDFPDPWFLPIDPIHLRSENNFRRFWWNRTGLEIIKFAHFTPVLPCPEDIRDACYNKT